MSGAGTPASHGACQAQLTSSRARRGGLEGLDAERGEAPGGRDPGGPDAAQRPHAFLDVLGDRVDTTVQVPLVALSAVLVLAAIIDQAGSRSLADHAAAMYAPYGKRPDPNLLSSQLAVSCWPGRPTLSWTSYASAATGRLASCSNGWSWSRRRKTRQFLAIVATPEVSGSCDGAWSAGSSTTDGEAAAVRAADRAEYLERRGMPDRGSQSPDRETRATRAHNHQQQGPCYRTAEDALMRSAALGACWTPA